MSDSPVAAESSPRRGRAEELLLATKLFIPPGRPDLLARPRLLERLDEGLQAACGLILVSAGAGFGKTTLLSAWSRCHPGRVAWLSLDEGDDDPVRFWTYAIAALRTLHPGLGRVSEAMLQALPPAPGETICAALLNDLAAVTGPIVLVLDDYHLITSHAVHDGLAFLLDHRPPQLHLAIATRADPPLALSRLRARRQIVDVRVEDLRCTPEEAQALLGRSLGTALTAADAGALAERTEGWITGLQMAVLSLRTRPPEQIAAQVAAFSGTQRYILDYLLEEVLKREPEAVQAFLLETSILDRLAAPLCDFVTGRPDAGAMLQHLESANLFLVPLDDERRWYRYHHLFADLLRARARDLDPQQAAARHGRASLWFERQGSIDAAVAHACAAGDTSRAAGLVERYGQAPLQQGQLALVLRWFEGLPDEVVLARPRLCVYHAWALLLTGRAAAAGARLEAADRGVSGKADAEVSGHVALLRAYLAALAGQAEAAILMGRQALEQLAPQDGSMLCLAWFILGGAYYLQGDLAGARSAMEQAAGLGRLAGTIHVAIPALNNVAGILIVCGRLRQAEAVCRSALEESTTAAGDLLPVAGGILARLAEIAYEWDDPGAALAYARRAIETSRLWGNVDALAGAHLALASVLLGTGDQEGARAAWQEAGRCLASQTATPSAAAAWQAVGVELEAAAPPSARPAGSPALGGAAPPGQAASPSDAQRPSNDRALLAEARRCIAGNRTSLALEILAPLAGRARAGGRTGTLIKALALQALALHARGDQPAALAALGDALALAEPEGYVRTFIDLGPAMAGLLHAALARGIAPGYLQRLIEHSGAGDAAIGVAQAARAHLIDPLSERELEVLRLVAAGLSNHAIAEALVIAESTVKSHVNTIFRKLDASNRTQAVARARELQVL